MNGTVTRMVLGISAVVAVALTLAGTPLAAGQGGQGPGGQGGRYGGPGGPMGRGRGGPGGPMGPDNPMMMLGRLDLTEAQRGQVKQILDSRRGEQKALGDREFAAHSALEASIASDGLNEAVIRGKAAEVAAVEADMAVMRASLHGDLSDADAGTAGAGEAESGRNASARSRHAREARPAPAETVAMHPSSALDLAWRLVAESRVPVPAPGPESPAPSPER